MYSASSKNYLNAIIKNIDKNNIIKQCYCRDDCIVYVEDYEEDFDKPNNKYNYVKDLKKINKELRKFSSSQFILLLHIKVLFCTNFEISTLTS